MSVDVRCCASSLPQIPFDPDPTNPGGTPIEAFNQIRAATLDRSQFLKDLSAPFYGANRPGAKVSQSLRDSFWLQGMHCGLADFYKCIQVFAETDLTEDLKRFDVPTLIIQALPLYRSGLLESGSGDAHLVGADHRRVQIPRRLGDGSKHFLVGRLRRLTGAPGIDDGRHDRHRI
jgi:hypothetical protein